MYEFLAKKALNDSVWCGLARANALHYSAERFRQKDIVENGLMRLIR